MSDRGMFYFDEGCVEKAFEITKGILSENGIEHPWLHTSCELKLSRKPGKEFISYRVEDEQKLETINEIVRKFDWESEGVTGFEEIKVVHREEVDVEIRVVGLSQVNAENVPDSFNAVQDVTK